MADAAAVLEAVLIAVYGILAVLTFVRWLRLRDAATAWACGVFVVLAGAVGASALMGDDTSEAAGWEDKALLAVFVLIPYLLFRFAATMRQPDRRLRIVAAALAAVASLSVLPLEIPEGDATSPAFTAYTIFVLSYWVGLSAIVARWMWRGGAGRPTVVRLRMRTLAAAVALLAVALLLMGIGGSSEPGPVTIATLLLGLVAGPLFLIGLAPPAGLLGRWRRHDEAALREAEAGLVAATSAAEVADALLPYVARTMGGEVAVLTDDDGAVVAAHGIPAEGAHRLLAPPSNDGADARYVTSIGLSTGQLHVVGDPYTPYFGREGRDVLARLAGLTEIALRRAEVTEAELRTAAELHRANEAMREFVSIASHDLRTPIAVVKGFAQTLSATWDTTSDEDKLTYIATIARQADHLSRIVSDLLTTSRLDAGAVEPHLEALDLRQLVGETLADLGHEAEVAIDAGTTVLADDDHAARIVRNLLENASHYGEPPVVVSAHQGEDHIDLRVRDHGTGVPASFVPRLFERFARAEASASKAKHGTGLGLAIVRGLARVGGGDVWYEPASPGACFVVRFRRADDGV